MKWLNHAGFRDFSDVKAQWGITRGVEWAAGLRRMGFVFENNNLANFEHLRIYDGLHNVNLCNF